MIPIEIVNIYPIPLHEGFAYITDLNNWETIGPTLFGSKILLTLDGENQGTP